MAVSKAVPALVLLALVCGELVVAGHAQTYIGGPAGTLQPRTYTKGGPSSPAGTQPPAGIPAYTRPTPGVEEEKAFMMHSLPPAHDGSRPVPVPPTAN